MGEMERKEDGGDADGMIGVRDGYGTCCSYPITIFLHTHLGTYDRLSMRLCIVICYPDVLR